MLLSYQAKPVALGSSEKQEKLDSLKKESEQLLNDIKGIGKEDKEERKVEADKDSHLNESERETVNEFRKELKVRLTASISLLHSILLLHSISVLHSILLFAGMYVL